MKLDLWLAFDVQETLLMSTEKWEIQTHSTEKILYPRVVP